MNAKFGWTLAVLAITLGWFFWGWRGAAVAISGAVFWLLLQFSQAMRAMRAAGAAPVGRVPSAVMLHARLNTGMRLLEVIQLTRSLGVKLQDDPETWQWRDESGASVQVVLRHARVTEWALARPDEAPGPAEAPPPAA